MSSLGNQWKVIRHYLSMTNINSELEKVIQKLKPMTPEQLDFLINKFERALASRLAFSSKQLKQLDNKEKSISASTQTDNAASKALKNEENQNLDATNPDSVSVDSGVKDIPVKNLLQGLKLKKDTHFGKISEPSWKFNKPIVSKSSIHSRTAYVISAIASAESNESLLKRTEHFIEHLQQYPESRDYAIKEGAIRTLLCVQHRIAGDNDIELQVKGIVNEALALLGYVGPTKGPGPNILSLDGGGIRGLIAIEILKHLEKITGKRVDELFDFIIGVSTGAIIASYIGSGAGTLDSATEMYQTLAKQFFGNTSVIGGTSRLVWSHSYYDTVAWEKMLQDNLKDRTLTECNRLNKPKLALVSCVVNNGCRLSPFVFRSYEMGYRRRGGVPGGAKARLWQAVRASAAAPTYFEEYTLHGLLHQDGGILVNNPTGVGVHEAKLLFGSESIKHGTVISVGTGNALNKHLDTQMMINGTDNKTTGTSWKDKFNKILDSATDTEGVHLVLNDLLPPGSYYRFNPPLMEECAMDEIDPVKLNNLIVATKEYIRRNQTKFEQAAVMLTRKRSLLQRALDYVHHRCLLWGIVQSY